MNIESLFEATKKDMIHTLERCRIEHMAVCHEAVTIYNQVLESLSRLDAFKKNHHDIFSDTSEAIVVQEEVQEISSVAALSTEPSNSLERPMYVFERKLRGGYVPDINGFVPEAIVRRLDLHHHDYVYADEIPSESEDSRKWYTYELAKKVGAADPKERVQLNYCPVEREGNFLVVRKCLEDGNDIRIHDVPYTLLLNDEDIREFSIQEGDIIDVAYFDGKPERHKVLWKYEYIEEEETAGKKKGKDKPKDSEKAIPQSLTNLSVLVIGNEPSKALYKECIEERGGTFLWADAKDGYDALEVLVKKSDLVIFLLSVSGHTGMKQAKLLCKLYNVPFEPVFGKGKSMIVSIAEKTMMSKLAM